MAYLCCFLLGKGFCFILFGCWFSCASSDYCICPCWSLHSFGYGITPRRTNLNYIWHIDELGVECLKVSVILQVIIWTYIVQPYLRCSTLPCTGLYSIFTTQSCLWVKNDAYISSLKRKKIALTCSPFCKQYMNSTW